MIHPTCSLLIDFLGRQKSHRKDCDAAHGSLTPTLFLLCLTSHVTVMHLSRSVSRHVGAVINYGVLDPGFLKLCPVSRVLFRMSYYLRSLHVLRLLLAVAFSQIFFVLSDFDSSQEYWSGVR